MQDYISSNNRLEIAAAQLPGPDENVPNNNRVRRERRGEVDSGMFRVGITEENISYI